MFEPTSTLPNFTLGKFSMVRKAIVNGGAIRPVGLLSSSDVIFCTPLSMLAINMFCTCFQGKCIIILWLL